MLGEARSKIAHLINVPLPPDKAGEFHLLYLAKGALATTAIEGNTLTETEALARVTGALALPPSREYLGIELDNIVHACTDIARDVMVNPARALTLEDICAYNFQVLEGLDVPPEVVPGELRHHTVGVGPYRGAPAEDVPALVEQLCTWLEGFTTDDEALKIPIAIVKAILAHLYIAWIHPFGDGNGRTARLVEFRLLFQAGAPTPVAHLLSNHYNQTRTAYYAELNRSSQQAGNPYPFVSYALQGLIDGLREQMERVHDLQWETTWHDYVHTQFRGLNTEAAVRRRHLVLDMPPSDEGIPRSELRHVSIRVAEAYAGKTDKTLTRDLNALKAMKLLRKTPDGRWRANWDITLASFLPDRVAQP